MEECEEEDCVIGPTYRHVYTQAIWTRPSIAVSPLNDRTQKR